MAQPGGLTLGFALHLFSLKSVERPNGHVSVKNDRLFG